MTSKFDESDKHYRTQEAREAKWWEANRKFIESYNAYIDRNGVFGEEFQDWVSPPV